MSFPSFKISRFIQKCVWSKKKLTPKQKIILQKLITKPKLGRSRPSEYKHKRIALTLFSCFYGGLSYKRLYPKAFHFLDKPKAILAIAEKRLDTLLTRIQWATTIHTARKWIVQKKICVNSQIVTIPSFQICCGDLISIERSCFQEIKKLLIVPRKHICRYPDTPTHLEVNHKTLSATLLYEPQQIIFPHTIELHRLTS
jgi:ribosomal protein S4